jgi:uncharacterized phage infection (PIP) family protein YhgE
MNAYELADKIDITKNEKITRWSLIKASVMLRKQQDEIDSLKKFIAESNALDKKLHESIQKANEMWGNATKSILKKAKDE